MPAFITASIAWFFDLLQNKTGNVIIATAVLGSLLLFSSAFALQFIVPRVPVPQAVSTALSIVAPVDWAAQLSIIISINIAMWVARGSLYLIESVK